MNHDKLSRFFVAFALGWSTLFWGLYILPTYIRLGVAHEAIYFSISFLALGFFLVWASVRSSYTSFSLKLCIIGVSVGVTVAIFGAQILDDVKWRAYGASGLILFTAVILGNGLGREVEKRSYFWPLILVAVGMDAWSVFSDHGVTYQILENELHLGRFNLMMISVPIYREIGPIIGVGDCLFMGFLAGAVVRVGLPVERFVMGSFIGLVVSLGGLLFWAVPMPLLVILGPVVGLSFGRRIRPRLFEILGALVFVVGAIGVVLLIQATFS